MVVSLFSIFDTSMLHLSWYTPLSFLGVPILHSYGSLPGISTGVFHGNSLISSQLENSSSFFSVSGMALPCVAGFIAIVSINSLGILPYVFTTTSHICFTMLFTISLWVCFTIYAWATTPGNALMTLVPLGTPFVLMPFMVVIESISLVIRPFTLSVRLTANMVAGHCLLGLSGDGVESSLKFFAFLPFQTMLMVLESAVAVIQGFVFIVLVTLYSKGTYSNQLPVMSLPLYKNGVLELNSRSNLDDSFLKFKNLI